MRTLAALNSEFKAFFVPQPARPPTPNEEATTVGDFACQIGCLANSFQCARPCCVWICVCADRCVYIYIYMYMYVPRFAVRFGGHPVYTHTHMPACHSELFWKQCANAKGSFCVGSKCLESCRTAHSCSTRPGAQEICSLLPV